MDPKKLGKKQTQKRKIKQKRLKEEYNTSEIQKVRDI
jgi:hypothetical protein